MSKQPPSNKSNQPKRKRDAGDEPDTTLANKMEQTPASNDEKKSNLKAINDTLQLHLDLTRAIEHIINNNEEQHSQGADLWYLAFENDILTAARFPLLSECFSSRQPKKQKSQEDDWLRLKKLLTVMLKVGGTNYFFVSVVPKVVAALQDGDHV